jgi:hypothetical protein
MNDIGGTAQPSDEGIADTIVSDGPVMRLLDLAPRHHFC